MTGNCLILFCWLQQIPTRVDFQTACTASFLWRNFDDRIIAYIWLEE